MKHMLFRSRRFRVAGVLFAWLFLALWLGVAARSHAAQDFSYAIDLNYRLDASGTTRVVSTYKVTNNRADKVLQLIRIATPTDDVKNLKVAYADGRSIKTSMAEKTSENLGYNYKYQEITVDFGSAPAGRGTVLSFTVSYDTAELMDIKGPSKTFYVPSLAQIGEDESYTVNVSVPQGFGKMIATGAIPDLNGTDGSLIRYTFPKAAELKRSSTLIFGDATVYNADFAFPLQNNSNQAQVMTVTLPPDTSTQKVFLKKLDPEPVRTRIDADGNVLADYNVPARSKITVHTDIAASVRYAEYDLSKSGTMKEIPAELKRNYTGATQYWQTTNPELQKKALQVTAGTDKVIDRVKNLQKLTIDTLTYNNEKIKYNIRQGSTKALENPDNAVCLEYSDLMIALLRSQGIPARMPVGYAYAGNLKQSKAVADSLHSWVEAYVPGIGWMNLDPTWGEKFDNFGKSDLDHFTFAIWGANDSLPAAVMVGTKDQNYQYEDTKVTYATDFPQAAERGQAKVQKYVLFPGITLTRYELTAPANVAGDKYAVQLKQANSSQKYEVGSLAPRQNFERTIVTFGSTYSSPAELVFLQDNDSGQQVLAVASGTAVWWPFGAVLLLLSGIIALILVELWLKKRRVDEAQFSSAIPLAVLSRDEQAASRAKAGALPESHTHKDQKDHHDYPQSKK